MAKRKKAKKTAGRKKATTRRVSAGSLGSASTEALAAEIRRREKALGKLEAKREKLMDQVAELDREIAAIGGALGTVGRRGPGRPRRSGGTVTHTAAGKPRTRPKNDQNLSDALVGVLSGQVMGVSEVADAVQKAGYKTSSDNFRVIVNQTLLRDKRIKKVARGQYTAK